MANGPISHSGVHDIQVSPMGMEEQASADDHDLTSLLEQHKRWFRESEDALRTSRRQSEVSRDFVDGKQWTPSETEALRKRGQEADVYNRMRKKANELIGIEQESRADPQAFPRTPQHEDDAELATDALRYVCDDQEFDKLASRVFDQACAVEGTSGCEVTIKPNRAGDHDVVLNFLPFDRLGWDPHSRDPDYADSRYVLVVNWTDASEAQRRWPERAEIISQTIAATPETTDDTYEDAPRFWADRTRNRVQVIQIWWTEGERWFTATFIGGGYLEDPQESPFVDEEGNSECGLVLCSGYVSRNGERYGAAQQWIGPQRDINARRTKARHILSTRQTVADPGVVRDKRSFKAEMARPDGHWDKEIEGELTVLPTGEMAAGQLSLLQEAKEEIDGEAAGQSMVPGEIAGASGVALQTTQRTGMLSNQPLLDNHRDWKLRTYRAIWHRIRQFWTAPRWIRVTDMQGQPSFVGVNMPMTVGQRLEQMGQQVPPEYASDPRLQAPTVAGAPAQLDVDIVLDEGPDVVTTAQQDAEILTKLKTLDPMGIPTAAIIRTLPLRAKDELLAAIEGTDETRAAQQQEQQQQAEMQFRAMIAQIAKTEADAALKRAQAAQTAAETPSEIEYTEARADKATAEAAKAAREVGQVVPFGA